MPFLSQDKLQKGHGSVGEEYQTKYYVSHGIICVEQKPEESLRDILGERFNPLYRASKKTSKGEILKEVLKRNNISVENLFYVDDNGAELSSVNVAFAGTQRLMAHMMPPQGKVELYLSSQLSAKGATQESAKAEVTDMLKNSLTHIPVKE